MLATVNGTKLYYAESGNSSGTPVVLIHGFPFSHEMWKPQVEVLSKNHRVVVYDVRGHGDSDAGDGQYTLEFFVDDLIGLLDHLKIEKAIVCGLSMGGYIALRAIERNPERFRALILCDTRSEADSNEAKLKRAAAIKTVKQQGVATFAEGFVKSVFAAETFTFKPEVVESIKNIIQRNSPVGICGALLALASRADTTASLPQISVPTLILVGEQDALTPPSVAKAVHEKIRNSELHVIPRAAHMSNLENPEQFNRHLLAFLEKLA
jgi:3-oxoadipate enol-lactonase